MLISVVLLWKEVEKSITGISEVRDTIKLYVDGKLDYEFSFTRVVILSFGDYQMSFEKVSYFSELIRVCR